MALPVDDFSDAAILEPVPAPITPQDITANLAPLTTNEVNRTFNTATPSLGAQRVRKEPTEEERFQAENARPDVPLYTRGNEVQEVSGMVDYAGIEKDFGIPKGLTSPLFRYQMARRHGLDSQLKYARGKLGDENARLSKDGKEIIVTVPNPEEPGKQMDVTVNDRDMTMGDFTALAAHVPEFAGAVLGLAAARAGRPEGARGFLLYLKDIIAGSLGQEVAGGLADAEVRLEDKEVVNPGQITMDRANNLIPDTVMGLGFGAAGKAAQSVSKFAIAPFSAARTEIQNDGLAAIARLKAGTGQDLTLSAGQASGSAPVIFSEQYLRSTASGSKKMEEFFALQQSQKQALFEALSAGGGTDEEIGKKLLARLQDIRNTAEQGLQSAGTSLEQKAGSGIARSLQKSSPTAPDLTPVQAGDKLRSEITAEHGVVMAERKRLYTEAYKVEGAQEAIVPTEGITSAIQDIKLPMRTVEKEVPNKLLDAKGRKTTETVESREPVREFLHSEVEQFLSTKLDPKMPIQEVVQMRDMLWDEIARGEAVKGIPTKQLTQISHSMTIAIDKGIADLPAGSELKTKLGLANEFYKKRVLKFEEAGIADIFKDVKDAGFKESHQIIERLASDPDKYLRTIKLLGPTSPGAKTIRDFVRDDLLRKSASDLDPSRMEAKRFIANLRQLREDRPDIYNDVVGARGDNLLEDATLMGVAQGSVSIKEAQQALTGKQKITELSDMLRRQKSIDDLKLNQLLKEYTVGKLDVNTINPEQLINGFLGKGTESEIRTLMDAIRADNPALGKQIERKMTEKLFLEAKGPDATDESIQKLLNDPKFTNKYKAILGDTQFGMIQDVAAYLGPIRRAGEIAKGTGSMVKGNSIGKFFKAIVSITKASKDFTEIIEMKVLSSAITNARFRQWVLNTPPEMHTDLAKAIMLSEPFINALSEDIADRNKLAGVVVAIRKMLSFGPTAQPEQQNTQKIPADQF